MAEPSRPRTPDDIQSRFIATMDRELLGWDDPVARLRAPLKALGFALVKADGTIIRQLTRSRVALVKMNAAVKVGKEIGVGVIAECMEEDDTLALVRPIDAGYAQGFGIARPEPVAEVAARDGPQR